MNPLLIIIEIHVSESKSGVFGPAQSQATTGSSSDKIGRNKWLRRSETLLSCNLHVVHRDYSETGERTMDMQINKLDHQK